MRHPVMLLLLNQVDMNRLCFLDFFLISEMHAQPGVNLHKSADCTERQVVKEFINQEDFCFEYKKWHCGASGDGCCQHVFAVLDESLLVEGKISLLFAAEHD